MKRVILILAVPKIQSKVRFGYDKPWLIQEYSNYHIAVMWEKKINIKQLLPVKVTKEVIKLFQRKLTWNEQHGTVSIGRKNAHFLLDIFADISSLQ